MRIKRAWRYLPWWQQEGIRMFNLAEWRMVPREQDTGIGYLPYSTRQYFAWLHYQDLFRCPRMWRDFLN